jgi:hypothetical protein
VDTIIRGDWSTQDNFSFRVAEIGVGARASEHQILMRRSSRAPQRLEPHLATETGRSGSGSTSGGSHLVRGQVEGLGEMPRSRYSW